jgi:hypothetical protein
MRHKEARLLERQTSGALAMTANWISDVISDPSTTEITITASGPRRAIPGTSGHAYDRDYGPQYDPAYTNLAWVIEGYKFRADITHEPDGGFDGNTKPRMEVFMCTNNASAEGEEWYVKVSTKADIGEVFQQGTPPPTVAQQGDNRKNSARRATSPPTTPKSQ